MSEDGGPVFLHDLGELDNWSSLDCLWWRTWCQHLGQPHLSILDIVSSYTFFFLLFCCFDRVLMSSGLSLVQPLLNNIFIIQGFWLIKMINLPFMVIPLTLEVKTNEDYSLSFEMSLKNIKWNLQCSQSSSSCPLALQSPRNTTRYLILFFFKDLGLYDV